MEREKGRIRQLEDILTKEKNQVSNLMEMLNKERRSKSQPAVEVIQF